MKSTSRLASEPATRCASCTAVLDLPCASDRKVDNRADYLPMILRNVLSNWSGFAVQVITTFLLTPIVLRSLGHERYGAWAVITSLTGYYGLLDLGFRSGLGQYLTRYLALGDYRRVNETASTGALALSLCGTVSFAVTCAVAWAAPWLFEVSEGVQHELQAAILIMGAAFALQFPFFVYSSVFTATQRYDLANGIGICTRVLSALATYAALHAGYGLLGICSCQAIFNAIDYLARVPVAYRVLPRLRISASAASLERFWELAQYGFWVMFVQAGVQLISATDTLIISIFLPLAAVTPYAIAANLALYVGRGLAPLGHVFFPVFTSLDATGNHEALRGMYLRCARVMMLVSMIAAVLIGCLAGPFLGLWIGPEVLDHNPYGSAENLFILLLVAAAADAAQSVAYQVFWGRRYGRALALILLCEAACNVVLSVCLLQRWGIVGVAAGTMIPSLVFKGIVVPLVTARLARVSFSQWATQVLPRPILSSLLVLASLLVLDIPARVVDWPTALFYGGIATALGLVIAILIGLDGAERQYLFFHPLRRLVSSTSPSNDLSGFVK